MGLKIETRQIAIFLCLDAAFACNEEKKKSAVQGLRAVGTS
jgi:hypothetical protein